MISFWTVSLFKRDMILSSLHSLYNWVVKKMISSLIRATYVQPRITLAGHSHLASFSPWKMSCTYLSYVESVTCPKRMDLIGANWRWPHYGSCTSPSAISMVTSVIPCHLIGYQYSVFIGPDRIRKMDITFWSGQQKELRSKSVFRFIYEESGKEIKLETWHQLHLSAIYSIISPYKRNKPI